MEINSANISGVEFYSVIITGSQQVDYQTVEHDKHGTRYVEQNISVYSISNLLY